LESWVNPHGQKSSGRSFRFPPVRAGVTEIPECQLTLNLSSWSKSTSREKGRDSRPPKTFLHLLFLQAHRETEAHFTAAGMPSQRNQPESFRFKSEAFYQGLKSKVGLAAAKSAALRINLNVQGCSIIAYSMHAPSRTSLLLPLILSHNLPLPRVH
jgi:hypothetical protein